jgi:hypothetical protein
MIEFFFNIHSFSLSNKLRIISYIVKIMNYFIYDEKHKIKWKTNCLTLINLYTYICTITFKYL